LGSANAWCARRILDLDLDIFFFGTAIASSFSFLR